MMTLCHHFLETPLGRMIIAASTHGVCLLEFVDLPRFDKEIFALQRLLKAQMVPGKNAHTRQAAQELTEYFRGVRQVFTVALHPPGTAFQQRVWAALCTLPYGTTTHYQALAAHIGKPTAVRAVAAANGANRVSILIPCHRVIGTNGALIGYGGGLSRKAWLLAHERGMTPSELSV